MGFGFGASQGFELGRRRDTDIGSDERHCVVGGRRTEASYEDVVWHEINPVRHRPVWPPTACLAQSTAGTFRTESEEQREIRIRQRIILLFNEIVQFYWICQSGRCLRRTTLSRWPSPPPAIVYHCVRWHQRFRSDRTDGKRQTPVQYGGRSPSHSKNMHLFPPR